MDNMLDNDMIESEPNYKYSHKLIVMSLVGLALSIGDVVATAITRDTLYGNYLIDIAISGTIVAVMCILLGIGIGLANK